MRWLIVLSALLSSLAGARPAAADDTDLLYRAVAIVTGTGEQNRQIGFRLCMEDVIVRVSGDYRLVTSGKAEAAIDHAADFVTAFSYRDRLEGIPVHDEQGTHDRPHDLTVDFDRAKVNAALAAMGARPWLDPRPRLAVFLGVENAAAAFVLSADGEEGFYMRDSLAAASDRVAVPIVLPPRARIADSGLVAAKMADAEPADFDAAARQAGGDRPLLGTLVWSDADRGWIATWKLAYRGSVYRWRIAGVSFDDAFRDALRGAAQVLSGNGAPDG
jgi:hypothetical protein